MFGTSLAYLNVFQGVNYSVKHAISCCQQVAL